jgi:hypothetical protein
MDIVEFCEYDVVGYRSSSSIDGPTIAARRRHAPEPTEILLDRESINDNPTQTHGSMLLESPLGGASSMTHSPYHEHIKLASSHEENLIKTVKRANAV